MKTLSKRLDWTGAMAGRELHSSTDSRKVPPRQWSPITICLVWQHHDTHGTSKGLPPQSRPRQWLLLQRQIRVPPTGLLRLFGSERDAVEMVLRGAGVGQRPRLRLPGSEDRPAISVPRQPPCARRLQGIVYIYRGQGGGYCNSPCRCNC